MSNGLEEIKQAIKDYYDDKPIDRFVEKILVEVCASHAEGESINSISKRLDIDRLMVKTIVETDQEFSNG